MASFFFRPNQPDLMGFWHFWFHYHIGSNKFNKVLVGDYRKVAADGVGNENFSAPVSAVIDGIKAPSNHVHASPHVTSIPPTTDILIEIFQHIKQTLFSNKSSIIQKNDTKKKIDNSARSEVVMVGIIGPFTASIASHVTPLSTVTWPTTKAIMWQRCGAIHLNGIQ